MKVGSKVAIRNYGGLIVSTIEKETKTLWICSNGDRYKKDDLFSFGSKNYGFKIERIDDAEEAQILKEMKVKEEKEALENEYTSLWRKFAYHMDSKWRTLSIEQLREIDKIVNEVK